MRTLIHTPASCCRLSMALLLICLQFNSQAQSQTMKTNLNQVAANGTTTLLDGNYTQYDNMYSDAVDWDDAWKMSNFGANLGILRDNITLVIERRKIIPAMDTTYYRMWNLAQGDYQLEIVTVNCNHPNLYGIVTDKYLNTKIPISLNGTTLVNFSITADPHTSASDRFALIYNTRLVPVPIKFLSLDGFIKGGQIQVNWAIEDETTMENYIVERSTDGINFTENQTVQALNTGDHTYTVMDNNPSPGVNYYRIKGINSGGVIQYSNLIKVPPTLSTDISIYPNPVTSKTVSLQIVKLTPGKYYVDLIHPGGTVQQLKTFEIIETHGFEQLSLPKQLNPGIYRLRFTGPDNTVITKTITVL